MALNYEPAIDARLLTDSDDAICAFNYLTKDPIQVTPDWLQDPAFVLSIAAQFHLPGKRLRLFASGGVMKPSKAEFLNS